MRILHTSDWHLGKTLEGRERLPEQEGFIEEISDIADREKVDLILIAGDIFDTTNPPARAESLFYQAIYQLSRGGRRGVVIIAGNHDNPERLRASDPLAEQLGITLLGFPKDQANLLLKQSGRVRRLQSGPGWLEIAIPNCEHTAMIIALPYPSEQRLKEVLINKLDEQELQKSYSERLGLLFQQLSTNYRQDTVNLCMSHLFVAGGKTSDSERTLSVGGAYTVESSMLPKKAQYIALGHLHRPQKIGQGTEQIRYSGSPLSYSFSEAGQVKQVNIIHCLPGSKAEVEEIPLSSGKPLAVWQAREGLEQAIKWCEQNRDPRAWIDLHIHLSQPLEPQQIKLLKEMRPDIVNIKPILPEMERAVEFENRLNLPVEILFKEFYYQNYHMEPEDDLVQLFLNLINDKIEGEEV